MRTRSRSRSRNNSPQREASLAIVEPLRIEFPFLEDQFQEDPPEVLMADNRIMAELLQAPTEALGDFNEVRYKSDMYGSKFNAYDFNEVRYKSDMYGSKFNAHSAMVFNSFILNSGLVEVSLGGCFFTWCHKTAAKMSKLDRFFVSESFLNSCPNINAIILERYLSDHRSILLRDAHVDYGPTPFRFFHYWLKMEGFAKMVEDGWRDSPYDRSNALRNLTKKLKHLKNNIRVWNKTKGNSNRDAKAQLKLELESSDGCVTDPRIIEKSLFNGYDPNSRKASWVKWRMVLASKDRGGLGVSSLYALNRGLLFKWLWRFYSKDSSLWAKVIMAINGSDGKSRRRLRRGRVVLARQRLVVAGGLLAVKSWWLSEISGSSVGCATDRKQALICVTYLMEAGWATFGRSVQDLFAKQRS
nr:RNA-directed DNA polymerase, eukaryota [Tanacetum cinerariifolium]